MGRRARLLSCALALAGMVHGCARAGLTEADAAPGVLAGGDAGAADAAGADGGPADGGGLAPRADAGAEVPEPSAQDATTAPPAAMDAGGSDGEATTPGCLPGVYEGTFEGRIAVLGLSLLGISGDIEINVGTSGDGERLSIENGSIEGSDRSGNPVRADVIGVLNCETLKLEGGALRNGTYVRENLNMTVQFEGVIEADYHPGAVPEVSGSWRTDGGLESGEGTFQARLRVP